MGGRKGTRLLNVKRWRRKKGELDRGIKLVPTLLRTRASLYYLTLSFSLVVPRYKKYTSPAH